MMFGAITSSNTMLLNHTLLTIQGRGKGQTWLYRKHILTKQGRGTGYTWLFPNQRVV